MTDAATSVTQAAVEDFTERYLRTLGCTINKRGSEWEVSIPEAADTDLSAETITLVCDADAMNGEDEPLHPESEFFLTILEEASNRAQTGAVRINADATDIVVPSWLESSPVRLKNAQFTPYYGRTAAVILYRITIETVSEYQQELLRAIAVDAHSEEVLPNLEGEVLELASPKRTKVETDDFRLERNQVEELIDITRKPIVADVQHRVDEVHEEASRAADIELEDYRQMQEQREEDLEKTLSNLRSTIEDLNEIVNQGDQQERVQALKNRKEKKAELQETEKELEELRERREQGFPEQQQEIRGRHALEVVVTPVTVTQVEYERGDVELDLSEGDVTNTITLGYGSGVGITEEVRCSSCSDPMSGKNPLGRIDNELICEQCS